MQYGFSGLTPQELGIIMQLKLRALSLQLVYIVRGSNASALASCQFLLEQAEVVQKFLESIGSTIEDDEFTRAMFLMLDQTDDPKPGTLAKLLLPLFDKPVQLLTFASPVSRIQSYYIILHDMHLTIINVTAIIWNGVYIKRLLY